MKIRKSRTKSFITLAHGAYPVKLSKAVISPTPQQARVFATVSHFHPVSCTIKVLGMQFTTIVTVQLLFAIKMTLASTIKIV
jgi:hypothetical protein